MSHITGLVADALHCCRQVRSRSQPAATVLPEHEDHHSATESTQGSESRLGDVGWLFALLSPFTLLRLLLVRLTPARPHAVFPREETAYRVPASPPSARNPHKTARPRPYIPHPAVPPDYDRFCQVHTRHRARWRLTYSHAEDVPYQAHNRVDGSIVLAASDLEALDFALTDFAPPRSRPYLDHALDRPDTVSAEDAPRGPSEYLTGQPTDRPLDHADRRALHDLAESTGGGSCWPSALREISLALLARTPAPAGPRPRASPEPRPRTRAAPYANGPLLPSAVSCRRARPPSTVLPHPEGARHPRPPGRRGGYVNLREPARHPQGRACSLVAATVARSFRERVASVPPKSLPTISLHPSS